MPKGRGSAFEKVMMLVDMVCWDVHGLMARGSMSYVEMGRNPVHIGTVRLKRSMLWQLEQIRYGGKLFCLRVI